MRQYDIQKERARKTRELTEKLFYELEIADLDSPEAYGIATEIVNIGRVKEKTPEAYISHVKETRAGKSCEEMKKEKEQFLTDLIKANE